MARPSRRSVVLGTVLVVMAAALDAYWTHAASGPVQGRASAQDAPEPPRTFDLSPGRSADVVVSDTWSIHIPEGGVSSDATMTVRPVDASAGPTGPTSLAAAVFELSTGQPAKPWVFSYHFSSPLPQGEQLFLLDDSGNGEAYGASPATASSDIQPATVREAVMSADRRSGTVEVTHLSFKEWITDVAGNVYHAINDFFGQRADPPSCQGKVPRWVKQTVFLDDQNGPMRVCVGADPANAEVAVVKIANNRGAAMLVTAPVAPTWAWQSVLGDQAESWVPNLVVNALRTVGVPEAETNRTYLLPPGQQVHLGFDENSLAGQAVIAAKINLATIAVGLVSRTISSVLDDKTRWWDFVLMGACLEGTAADVQPTAPAIAKTLTSLARCAVEQPETILDVARKAMEPAAWQARSPAIYSIANAAKKLLTRYLLIAEAAFTAVDIIATLSLPPAAFTVTVTVTRQVLRFRGLVLPLRPEWAPEAIRDLDGTVDGYVVRTTAACHPVEGPYQSTYSLCPAFKVLGPGIIIEDSHGVRPRAYHPEGPYHPGRGLELCVTSKPSSTLFEGLSVKQESRLADIGSRKANYLRWRISCTNQEQPSTESFVQRDWHLPTTQLLVTDPWSTAGLDEALARAVWE
ncbi:hypothetical protein ABZ345_06585 [Lentzea sp. NPDC005914]|uniref:hypothetical protein n=1 Tax=Lentzea sp. NPDC005914 TaxID=3154572 RepID=UPI0033F14147